MEKIDLDCVVIKISSMTFPYNYVACPCTNISSLEAEDNNTDNDSDNGEEKTFDPRSPRANFALFPLEHLLYCEECQQIKCPRCTVEEIICWYCPSCLFEMPASMVKSEGGRWVSRHASFPFK